MAKVKIQGNASGTGVLTVTAPNTSTDRTVTLPDATGTLLMTDGDGSSLTGLSHTPEGTAVLSTGETGGTKFLREDGDNTSSWQAVPAGGISNVVEDTTPQLGGHLDNNGKDIKVQDASGTNTALLRGNAPYLDIRVGGSFNAVRIVDHSNGSSKVKLKPAGINIATFSATGASKGSEFNADGKLTISSNTSSSTNLIGFYNTNINVGNIISSGSSTSYSTSSDYRLKENVVPMVGSIDRLKTLKPSHFNFIADADTTVDGFLAHEAQEVVPEAITGTKDAVDDNGDAVMQGIDQSKLVPLLVASLQEAIAKIEELTTRIETLEGGN